MRETQARKFWEALDRSTEVQEIINSFANKRGYGGARTMERYAQAHREFRRGASVEEVSRNTGWSLAYVLKIRGWWEGLVPQEPSKPPLSTYAPGPYQLHVPVAGHSVVIDNIEENPTNVSVTGTVDGHQAAAVINKYRLPPAASERERLERLAKALVEAHLDKQRA